MPASTVLTLALKENEIMKKTLIRIASAILWMFITFWAPDKGMGELK